MPLLLSLGSGASLYGSSSFLSEVFLHCPDFSSSGSSWLVSFGFPSMCTGFSFPQSFVPCVCSALGPSSLLPPSSLAASSLGVLCPLIPFYRSWSSLPGVILLLSFHCHSFRGPLSIFGLVPHLSVISYSIDGLILLCQLSPVFCRVLSHFGCTSVGGSFISSPLDSPSSWWLVFLHSSSHSWSPSSTASSDRLRLLLYLSWPSPSTAVLRFSVPSTSWVVVSFSLSPCLVAPWGVLALRLGYWGLRSVLTGVSVPCCFHLPLSCLQSLLLWSTSHHFDVCLLWLLSLPFQCAPISFFGVGASSICLVFLPCVSLLGFHFSLSLLQVVSSCPSLGALLTRSNLRSTTRRGLPLGRVSFWFASWNFLMVPIPLSLSFRSSHVLLWTLF